MSVCADLEIGLGGTAVYLPRSMFSALIDRVCRLVAEIFRAHELLS
jgi:hypothetical protein